MSPRKLTSDVLAIAPRRGHWLTFVVAALALIAPMAATTIARADDMAAIQYGVTGPGAGTSGESYDREFIREWESNPPKGFTTLSKSNIAPTKAAIKRYEDIVAQGGWAPLSVPQGKPSEQTLMQAGVSDPEVRLLRLRLAASGDLKDDDFSSTTFDLTLEKALKRFQASNGLTPTGIADKRTIAALNVPADARLKQLKANLPRLQSLSGSVGKRYVVVNIPAAQIEAVENGEIVARYAGVVGKADRPTPLLTSSITDLNFNPVWRLPPTVISEDLIPRGREMQANGKNVLEKFGIDAYDGAGKKVNVAKIDWTKVQPGTYSYSQQPGSENPLGFLKINFGNAHSVYMHDTPSERIFGRNFRSASSGCIRVHNIDHLAAWLLVGQPGWNPHRISRMRETGERLDVRLKKPVALHFVYLTAWATDDGVVQFRRDIYQRDGVGEVAAAY
ncbi:MAG: murein L,D-transpeptidase [Hyphomicrobium sp.]